MIPKSTVMSQGGEVTDEKAGACSNCRAGNHTLCMSRRCGCPKGGHRNRPGPSPVSDAPRTGLRPVEPPPAMAPVTSARNTAQAPRAEKRKGPGRPPDPAPTPAKAARNTAQPTRAQATVEVRWEEPPTPKPRGATPIEARVAPVLDEVAERPGHWARLVTHPSRSWGKTNARRLTKHYGSEGWTFVGGALEDEPGSAVWAKFDVPVVLAEASE